MASESATAFGAEDISSDDNDKLEEGEIASGSESCTNITLSLPPRRSSMLNENIAASRPSSSKTPQSNLAAVDESAQTTRMTVSPPTSAIMDVGAMFRAVRFFCFSSILRAKNITAFYRKCCAKALSTTKRQVLSRIQRYRTLQAR